MTVAGLASATFTDQIQVVDNQSNNEVGFGDNTTSFAILFARNPGFGSYDLTTSIGPLSGTSVGNPGTDAIRDRRCGSGRFLQFHAPILTSQEFNGRCYTVALCNSS